MMNELVTHDEQGRFIRESYQATEENESKNVPLVLLPAASEEGPRYRLYLGNPCPWCHRVKSAISLLQITDIPITMLIDDAEKASKGGWVLPKPSPRDDSSSSSIANELLTGDLAGVYNYLFRHVLKDGER